MERIDSRQEKKFQQSESSATSKGKLNIQQTVDGADEIDLSSSKLYDLNILSDLTARQQQIEEIYLNRNYLANIDVLNNLKKLRKVSAKDNYIASINLNLPNLKELDLRNNFIEKIPTLKTLPLLTSLNISNNKVQSTKLLVNDQNFINLERLDLQNNQISFQDGKQQVNDLIEKFRKFKKLKFIALNGNPFETSGEHFMDEISAQLPACVETFNNNRIQSIQSSHKVKPQLNHTEHISSTSEQQTSFTELGTSKISSKKKKGQYIPTLDTFCHVLEQANNHPNKALDYLQTLFFDIERISQLDEEKMQNFYSIFVNNGQEQFAQDKIDSFMQNSMLLIDNHYEMRSLMLSILSKLTFIKQFDFGRRCFDTLKDMMVAGKDLEVMVFDVLQREVILKLQNQKSISTPSTLLNGLQELVEESGQTAMLFDLFKSCFPKALRELKQQIYKKRQQKLEFEDDEYFDAILGLLAVSVKGDALNVQQLVKKDLVATVSEIFLNSAPHHVRYLHLLCLITGICEQDQNNQQGHRQSDSLIHSQVHARLLDEIKQTYNVYKKQNDLISAKQKVKSQEELSLKYRTFAMQIQCVCSLLNCSDSKLSKILSDQNGSTLYELMQIAGNFRTDPLILTAVCKLTTKFLELDSVKDSKNILEKIVNNIKSCTQLIPYLGLEKYEEVCKMTMKYQSGRQEGHEDAYLQVNNQQNPIIHDLFISIIQLISLFGRENEIRKQKLLELGDDYTESNNKDQVIQEIYQQVCEKMNDSDREKALFISLQVPNDEVRLEVVKCLYNVPLDEFDVEEIAEMVNVMKTTNIGVGNTEIVLSCMIWIFTKLVRDTESSSGQLFRAKFCSEVIDIVLPIIQKNQQRNVPDEDEEVEKYTLSISITNFLQFVSLNKKLSANLFGKSRVMSLVLSAEQQSLNMLHTPIDIENTSFSMSFANLRNVITQQKTNCVQPFNYVSFRVLVKIANLLQHNLEITPFDDFAAGEDITERMFDYQRQKLQTMITDESSLWQEPSDIYAKMNEDSFEEFKHQHKLFTNNQGVELLMMFLLKNDPQNELWLTLNKDQQIEVYYEGRKNNKIGKDIKRKNQHQTTNQLDNYEQMQISLKCSDLGDDLQSSQTVDQNIQIRNQQLKRDNNAEVGIKSLKLRSISTAALLRCLYASIEYAPTPELAQTAINVLRKDEIFAAVSQLCSTTGWLEANIAIKYLKVFRNVIKLKHSTNSGSDKCFEQNSSLMKYQTISYIVSTLLIQLRHKINIEQENLDLSQDDLALISQISIIMYEMALQITFLEDANFQRSAHEKNQNHQQTQLPDPCQVKVMNEQILHAKTVVRINFEKLFPVWLVNIFIEIVFRDMKKADELFNTEDAPQQKQSGGVFMRSLASKTREFIKKFLGEFNAFCPDLKYQVLQSIMERIVIERQVLRSSYLTEILECEKYALMRYQYSNWLSVNPTESLSSGNLNVQERAIICIPVLVAYGTQENYKANTALLLTTLGLYFIETSSNCSKCPKCDLCLGNPLIIARIASKCVKQIIEYQYLENQIAIISSAGPQQKVPTQNKSESSLFFWQSNQAKSPTPVDKSELIVHIVAFQTFDFCSLKDALAQVCDPESTKFTKDALYTASFKCELNKISRQNSQSNLTPKKALLETKKAIQQVLNKNRHSQMPLQSSQQKSVTSRRDVDAQKCELDGSLFDLDNKSNYRTFTVLTVSQTEVSIVIFADEFLLCFLLRKEAWLHNKQVASIKEALKEIEDRNQYDGQESITRQPSASQNKSSLNSNNQLHIAIQQLTALEWAYRIEKVTDLVMIESDKPTVQVTFELESGKKNDKIVKQVSFMSDLARQEFTEHLYDYLNSLEQDDEDENNQN